jgi:hypothetical protein
MSMVRGPFFCRRSPAHLLFDAKDRGHQLLRRLAGFERDRTIQKPWLLGELHRLGFVNDETATTRPRVSSRASALLQLGLAVADIRSQRKIDSDGMVDGIWPGAFIVGWALHPIPWSLSRTSAQF